MATYYVRKTGSDAAAGTSPATAWSTIGKLLGTTGLSSGDTAYVGGGVYREVVGSTSMVSATVETKIIGDVTGAFTGDAGEVQWTAYTTDDRTAPGITLLNLSGRDFLTFENILFIGGSGTMITMLTNTSTNITFRRSTFIAGNTGGTTTMNITSGANAALNLLVDSCIFVKGSNIAINITPVRPATADFDLNVIVKNCLFIGGIGVPINLAAPTGANLFNTGGVLVYNCTHFGYTFFNITANWSTSIPCTAYNNYIYTGSSSQAFVAATLGTLVENYNVVVGGGTPRVNVNIGANSITDGSYAPLFYTGHENVAVGSNIRPFAMPKIASPLLNFGNQASSPTVDILGVTRPVSTVLPSVGCYEISNTAVKETTTVRTGSNAIKIASAGYHDFDIPVAASAATITVYGRYDGSYAGTLPSMNIIKGTECGVSDASDVMVVGANTWEQLSLSFIPTTAGIITIRLISSTTAPTGNTFFDDFSII